MRQKLTIKIPSSLTEESSTAEVLRVTYPQSRHSLLRPPEEKKKQSPNVEREAKWPARQLEQIDAIVRSGTGLYDLWGQSPVRFSDHESRAEEIVDVLFPSNPSLCAGKSERHGVLSGGVTGCGCCDAQVDDSKNPVARAGFALNDDERDY